MELEYNNMTKFLKREEVKSLYELKKLLEQKRSLSEKKDKIERIRVSDKLNDIESKLNYGITLDSNVLNNYIDTIYNYVSKYNYDKEKVQKTFSGIALFTSFIKEQYHGQFATFDTHIGVDVSYCNFDEEGIFTNFKKEKINTVNHAFVHELFHIFSRVACSNMNLFLYGDPFSEGLTEMFTRKALINDDVTSSFYIFSEKVCTLFEKIIGEDKIFEDYTKNLGTWTNIRQLFTSCGQTEDDFNKFYDLLTLNLQLNSQKNESNLDEIEENETSLKEYLEKNIVNNAVKVTGDYSIKEDFTKLFGTTYSNSNDNKNNKVR